MRQDAEDQLRTLWRLPKPQQPRSQWQDYGATDQGGEDPTAEGLCHGADAPDAGLGLWRTVGLMVLIVVGGIVAYGIAAIGILWYVGHVSTVTIGR